MTGGLGHYDRGSPPIFGQISNASKCPETLHFCSNGLPEHATKFWFINVGHFLAVNEAEHWGGLIERSVVGR